MTTIFQTPRGEVYQPTIVKTADGSGPNGSDNNAPFFIVGAGRSGTTLLRIIMMGHSRLHISPETHFIRLLVKEIPLNEKLTPEQVALTVDRIVTHPRWTPMEVPEETFRAQAMALTTPRLAEVLNLIYHSHLRKAGKVRFGDKTPDYVCIVPELLAIYRNAKFIHLIRDGHDVAISFAEVGWGHAYQGQRFSWTRAVRAGLTYRHTPFAD